MLELLDATQMSATQRDNLHIAKRSADHLLFLVNDLLDVVRIEKGKLEICPAPFSLRGYLDSLSLSFACHAESCNIHYVSRLGQDLPDVVVGDKDRLSQVLNNIVGNALKFTPPGGTVTLAVSRPSRDLVRLHGLAPDYLIVDSDDDYDSDVDGNEEGGEREEGEGGEEGRGGRGDKCLLFEVSDTGIGIPHDKLEHIFEAFYQVDPAHTKKYAGLGMGLKITSELVRFAEDLSSTLLLFFSSLSLSPPPFPLCR
jgi:signal transduction histidine kinase